MFSGWTICYFDPQHYQWLVDIKTNFVWLLFFLQKEAKSEREKQSGKRIVSTFIHTCN